MEEESEANKKLRKEVAELRKEVTELRSERDSLLIQRNALEALFNRYEDENKSQQNQAVVHGGFKVTEETLARVLAFVFPNIVFQRDSIRFLIEQAHNQGRTIDKLQQLNQNPGNLRGQRVESADGWIEVKYGTEGSTEDRLYFRHCSKTGKCLVLLSKKRMQKKDFRNLA